MRKTLFLVTAALALTVVSAAPSAATNSGFMVHYEGHLSNYLWSWGHGTEQDPAVWFSVGATQYTQWWKSGQSSSFVSVCVTLQSSAGWPDGEAMTGCTREPDSMVLNGNRIISVTADVEMYECLDWIDCRYRGEDLGPASIAVNWTVLPGQYDWQDGEPPGNGHRFAWGGECQVGQSVGLNMFTNADATASWTMDGLTRTFPEDGVEYDSPYGIFNYWRGMRMQVCVT